MSGIDISILLYRLLNVPEVTDLLDGGEVHRFNRPINSREKDIVISIPEYNSGEFNTGYVDINIHVPNLQLQDDQTSPDLASMQEITEAVLPLLTSVDGYTLNARIPGIPVRDADGQWYCNIRIGFSGIDDNLSENITLLRICSEPDGYGGSKACLKPVWQGKAAKMDNAQGTLLDNVAGVFRMEGTAEWLLPKESKVGKGHIILSDEGEFVVRSMVPDRGFLRIFTRRKDGKTGICCP